MADDLDDLDALLEEPYKNKVSFLICECLLGKYFESIGKIEMFRHNLM